MLLAPHDYTAAFWRAYEAGTVDDHAELSALRAHAELVRQRAVAQHRDRLDVIVQRRRNALRDAAAVSRSRRGAA